MVVGVEQWRVRIFLKFALSRQLTTCADGKNEAQVGKAFGFLQIQVLCRSVAGQQNQQIVDGFCR